MIYKTLFFSLSWLLLTTWSNNSIAEIYKCIIEQQVIFSQTPCAENAQTIELQVQKRLYRDSKTKSPKEHLTEMKKLAGKMEVSRLIRQYQHSIKRLDKDIIKLQQSLQQELAIIQQQTYNPYLNYPIEVFEQNKANKIKKIKRKYNSKIQALQKQHSNIRNKLEKIKQ